MQYWLLKSEPDAFSWDDLNRDKIAVWDGVRNYQARNNLKLMQVGDLCYFYHSVSEKAIVGITAVVKEWFPDPTDDTGKWASVELVPVMPLNRAISLEEVKQQDALTNMVLANNTRLSVAPVTPEEWNYILKLSGTTLPQD